MKKEFLHNELFLLSMQGAFQRASVYKNKVSETDKKYFKRMIKEYLNHLLESYKNTVSEEEHVQNIVSLSEHTKVYGIFRNDKLNIGVSQKLLNLYLKYHWCLSTIEEPVHCPVDRIIQVRLNVKPLVAWTKIKTIEEYLLVINRLKSKLKENQTIAYLELENFERNI